MGVLPFEGPAETPGALDLATAALKAARRGEHPILAIGRAKTGEGITLNAVWQEYARSGYPKLRGVGRKRDSTIARDKDRYDLLLRPSLGKKKVERIDTARVRRWLDEIPTEGQRSHALVMLKSLLTFAGSRGLSKVQPIDVKGYEEQAGPEFLSTGGARIPRQGASRTHRREALADPHALSSPAADRHRCKAGGNHLLAVGGHRSRSQGHPT